MDTLSPAMRSGSALNARTNHILAPCDDCLRAFDGSDPPRGWMTFRKINPRLSAPSLAPSQVYFVQLEGIFSNPNFRHEKIKIFKKSSNFKKSSLGDKLKSAILATNSKKQKRCINLNSEPPFARGSRYHPQGKGGPEATIV